MHAAAKPLLDQHVPSRGLVVAGDSANNDVHLHLGDANVKR